MRIIISILAIASFVGCTSMRGQESKNKYIAGIYTRDSSSEKLDLKNDGTFILQNPEISFSPVIEQCDYASKGKWSFLANNVIEITSENYYFKQDGFKFDLKKESKFSQDSIYIKVNFSSDFHPVNLNFVFNNDNNKAITTNNTYLVLPKAQYLWNRRTSTNHISFNLNANISGTVLYKGRILFKIFEENIDTEKSNYLTITLSDFDRCFFEFEPYYKELILINKDKEIFWNGDVWRKM